MAEQVVVQGRQKNTTRQRRCVVPRLRSKLHSIQLSSIHIRSGMLSDALSGMFSDALSGMFSDALS